MTGNGKVKNVYLTGMMGCGKTSVGRLLAHSLNAPFFDLDDETARRADMSIPDIFESEGEVGFRKRESDALFDLADACAGAVIACGGGTVTVPKNTAKMKETGAIIYIDRPVSHILKTVSYGKRPLIAQGKEQALRAIYDKRASLYRDTADAVFDNLYDSASDAVEALAVIARDYMS